MSRQLNRHRNRRRSLSWLETLESRTLLTGSTFEVTTSADSGPGTLREAILDADSLGGGESISIIFDLPSTDPGYNPGSGGWNLTVNSTLPTLTASGVTIDTSEGPVTVPGGILIEGMSDPLTLIGDGIDSGVDNPDPSTTGNGSITEGGFSISYSGISSLTVSNLVSLTFETSNAGNDLIVSSPSAAINEISGSSGGVALAPLSFSFVTSVVVDTAAGDTSSATDSIMINASGFVAAGLQNFTLESGATSATLTDLAASLALPVTGGAFLDSGSTGYDNTVVAQADVNYSLSAGSLAIPGSGSLALANVQDVQLTGGADSSSFMVQGWLGDLALNGGPGSNQLTFIESGSYAGNLTLSNFASTSIQIGGDFQGTITAPQTSTIQQILISGNDDAGSSITAGAFVASAGSTSPAVQVLGDFGGSITASENLAITGSGVLGSILIDGNLLATTGQIMTGSIGTITIGEDLDGTVTAMGAGTIGTITVGGNLTGTVTAPEDPNPGSGKIGTVTVGGSLTGTISSGNISGIVIGKDLVGVIIAEGAGTIGTITVGGNLTGTVLAPEDPHPGSGTIGTITVGGSVTGTISSGNISGIVIGKDLVGVIIASGAGTIGNVVVAGNLSGEIDAELDPNSSGSAELGSITVGGTLSGTISAVRQVGQGIVNSVGATGSIEAGNITTSLSINSSTGSIQAGNVANFTGNQYLAGIVQLGNVGTLTLQSLAADCTIDATGIAALIVNGSLAGVINDTGNLPVASISQNLTGQLNVTGTLGVLVVGGSTSGSIQAGQVGTISAAAATGPVVLQIEQGGVERQLQAATSSDLFPLPGQTATGTLAATTFRYFYESGSLANPQLTVQVNNQSKCTTADQFDLSLVTDSSTAKFNLARLDSVGVSGIGNITVEGDILTSVSTAAQAFFSNDSTKAGIQLPQDNLAGVGVRDFIPYGGYISAASIQAVSVGLVGLSWGQSVAGAYASAYAVQSLLSPTTRVVEASNTFRVPFTGSSTDQVGFYMDDNSWGQFDWSDVSLTIQNEVSYNPATKSNIVTLSNVARGSDVALITVGLSGGSSQINGISIQGDGASITTFQSINGPIVSTGSLGDLSLLGSSPVGNITATSIFGTIMSYAAYRGVIQTTGLWTNPITEVVSDASADFGRDYLNSWNQLSTTTFETYSGSFTGQLIVRGNLVSNVIINGSSTGAIAVQGNIGTIVGNSRLGGITINGNETGSIVSLGQMLGDTTINGNLGRNGTISSSQGIVGNLTVNGSMASSSKIISGGAIGSTTFGTRLTVYGTLKGLIASEGNLIEWPYDFSPTNTISNAQGTANGTVIDEVLAGLATSTTPITDLGSTPCSLDLADYDDLMTMMAELQINKSGQLFL